MNSRAADQQFIIREANGPEDAAEILKLVQELADYQHMPHGPSIDGQSIAEHLKTGKMFVLVAITTDKEAEMAAYSMYYVCTSGALGQPYMFLEDLYIKMNYRRQGLGRLILGELAKIANSKQITFLEWNVLRDNGEAIAFYKGLRGLEDLTELERVQCWRLGRDNFERVLQRVANNEFYSLVEIIDLADRKNSSLTNLILALESLKRKEREFILHYDKQTPFLSDYMAVAFFNSTAYSSWNGPYPVIDKICIKAGHSLRNVAIPLMAKLIHVAQNMGAARIGWNEPTAIDGIEPASHCLKSLGAVNLTESEGWLLYKWDYEKHYETKSNSR